MIKTLLLLGFIGLFWFYGADDLKKKGRGFFMRNVMAGTMASMMGLFILIGYLVLFGGSDNKEEQDVASQPIAQIVEPVNTPANIPNEESIQLSNLLQANGSEWLQASYEDQFNACTQMLEIALEGENLRSDIRAKLNNPAENEAMASGMLILIDQTFNSIAKQPPEHSMHNTTVATVALSLMLREGWFAQ